jgi:L-alanine-DL-glutamate epimerase-like enolase superfamily enzyme
MSGLSSKITDVECLVLPGGYPFVLVHTEDGLTGIGECDHYGYELVAPAVERLLKPLLVGQNALDTNILWDRMAGVMQRMSFFGIGPAASGIDIALWDLKGKALGVPIHQLMGGKRRDRVKFYASSLRRDMSVKEEVARAVKLVEQGWRAYKLHGAIQTGVDDPADHTVETVKGLRAELGPDVDILVDVNGAYSRHHAIAIGRQLEELGVHHFEEPVKATDLDGLAKVAAALDIPVAAGERCYNRWQMYDLARHGHVDILQPDALRIGGLTELLRVEAMASTMRVPITLHNVQPTVATVAHVHFGAVSATMPYAQEYNIEPSLIRDEQPILAAPLEIEPGGFIRVPEGPGLGIELDLPLMRRLAEAQ